MIQTFPAVHGQSLYDICLNTYGTLELLYKLLQDNGIDSLNVIPYSRQPFLWDDSLVTDQGVNTKFAQSGTRYATDIGLIGSTFYTVKGTPTLYKSPAPGQPLPPNADNDMVTQVNGTSYQSNADGTTVITLLDKDGLSMIGNDLIVVTIEIKPLRNDQWSWNKSTGILTLLLATTVDNLQTLFAIYSKIIPS